MNIDFFQIILLNSTFNRRASSLYMTIGKSIWKKRILISRYLKIATY
jgi:hypothetical protein